jgi:hypothetical protein
MRLRACWSAGTAPKCRCKFGRYFRQSAETTRTIYSLFCGIGRRDAANARRGGRLVWAPQTESDDVVSGMAANRAVRRPEGQGAAFPGAADNKNPAAAPVHSALPDLWPMSAIVQGRCEAPPEAATIARWAMSYLMRPHPQLGRPGDVCPFAAQASRLDTIRIGVCDFNAGEVELILRAMEGAVRAFDALPSPTGMSHFRTILVGFPNCAGHGGLRVLRQIQNRLRPHSIYRAKMIGLFEPNSNDRGLLNPDFRPLRSPIPLLAIRVLVENDSPFVLRNPRLAPIYLAKFRGKGLRRLIRALWP